MPDPVYEAALASFRRGDFAAAERRCGDLLARRSDDADALALNGLCRARSGDADAGIALIRRALSLRDDWRFRASLAEILERKGDARGAAAELGEAWRLNPAEEQLRRPLIRALRRWIDQCLGESRWDAAADALGFYADLEPGDPWLACAQGCLALFEGGIQDAVGDFGRAQRLGGAAQIAQEGLAVVELTRVHWPARRDVAPARPAPGGAGGEPVRVVYFYVGSAASRDDRRWLARFLNASAQSVRRACPGARVTVITDEHTALPDGFHADRLIRRRIDPAALMYERKLAERDYLRSPEYGGCTVFLDVDCVVLRDLSAVFERQFDVALTWRGWPALEQFINEGVILVRPGAAARAFYDELLACYDSLLDNAAARDYYHCDLRRQRGSQLALATLVNFDFFSRHTPQAMRLNDVDVAFFPCETHNYSPSAPADLAEDNLRDRLVLHFKGERKHLLDAWLDRCASPRSS